MKLISVLRIMAFSLFFSCIPEKDDSPDIEDISHAEIVNLCNDDIYYEAVERYIVYVNNIQTIQKHKGLDKHKLSAHSTNVKSRLYNSSKPEYFSQFDYGIEDTIWFYYKDKIKIFVGPMCYKHDSIHDIFNYNSWDSIPHPKTEGEYIFRFTLTDKDFEQ